MIIKLDIYLNSSEKIEGVVNTQFQLKVFGEENVFPIEETLFAPQWL